MLSAKPPSILLLLIPALAQGPAWGGSAHGEPLSRNDAVRLALERNPAVEAARNAWEGARALARQGAVPPDPEFGVELEEVPSLGGLGDSGERAIGFSHQIENPLKWWHRLQAGRRQAEATRLAVFEATRLDIILEARTAYDRVALHQSLLQLAREDHGLAGDMLRQAEIRFDSGDVAQLEVMRAEVEMGRATNRLTAAENGLSAARAGLNALLARPLGTPFTLADSLVFRPPAASLDQFKETALSQRPELAAIALELQALRSRQAEATAAYLPDLNLGLARQQRHGSHEGDSWRWTFFMEVPLWAFTSQRAERARARAEAAQVAAEGEALRNRILLETEEAYLNLDTAAGQVALFQDRILPGTERALAAASRSYDEGESTYLELLEARRLRIETLVEYAHALFEYGAADAALERAVSGPPATHPQGE